MADQPHLRAIAPDEARPAAEGEAGGKRRRPSWLVLTLAGVLVVAILLLAWGRVWYERRVAGLEEAAAALQVAVEQRELVIEAQRARLEAVGAGVDDVRARLEDLRGLLQAPLPEPD